jgi:hypothetical protein
MIPEQQIINVIKEIKIKNYELIKIVNNFFIWKLKDKKQYIRLCLISNGWNENKNNTN